MLHHEQSRRPETSRGRPRRHGAAAFPALCPDEIAALSKPSCAAASEAAMLDLLKVKSGYKYKSLYLYVKRLKALYGYGGARLDNGGPYLPGCGNKGVQ